MNFTRFNWRGLALSAAALLSLGGMAALFQGAGSSGAFTAAAADGATTAAVSESPGYLDLDGSRYVSVPYSSEFDIPAGGTRTVTAKVWLDSYGAHRGIVANRFNASTNGNGGTTGFEIYGGNSASQSFSNNVNLNKGTWNNIGHVWCNTLPTGRWAHVSWVYDGENGSSRMYIDADLKHEVKSDAFAVYPINPQSDILIGARYTTAQTGSTVDGSSYWLGKIDDVRIYEGALTDEELAADMTAEVDETTPGLIAAYDFTLLTGTNCPDISGNGHDAVLHNFPDYSATGSRLTIETPAPGTGTLTVADGDRVITSGSRVEDGTVLTVTATPATDYSLEAIYVNGTAIEGNTFTMNGETTVSASFLRDASAPTKVLVFDMNQEGSKYYRIPAIVTAADGSLVVLADKRGNQLGDLPNTISVVSKRSTDGGETWSESVTVAQGDAAAGKTYGDPAVVLDRTTGNLVAVFAGDTGFFVSTKSNRAGFYVSISEDNGLTWSEPRAITDQVYQDSWYGAFCASGRMLQTESGRIMFVANTRLSSAQWVTDVYEFVCASDDGGQTWTVLNPDSRIPADGNGNESKLVELSDGSLIMSIRSDGKRRFSRSTDGGVTWTAATSVMDLNDPSCNGDIMVYPSPDGQTRMIHSLPDNGSVRRDVSISLSYDEGKTWPVKKRLIDNYSAYSALTVLPDGSIGCFVEEGKWDSNISGEDGFRLYFMKFTLDWLTDGADAPEPDPVFDGTLNCDGTRYMYIDHAPEFDIEAGGQMTVTAKVWLDEYGVHRGVVSNRWHAGTANAGTTGFDIFAGGSAANSMSNNVNMNKGSWNNIGHVWCNTVTTENWHWITWVFDGQNGTSKIYLDGDLKHTVTKSDISNYPLNPQAAMLVGARYDVPDGAVSTVNTNWLWKGKIDDVRFYSRALTTDEVVAEMTATVGASTPDLIAAYDFAEIKGAAVTDISGNGHTGTLVGFPDNSPGYTVNLGEYDTTRGSLKVFNGANEVLNGRNVEAGTELTIVAEPLEGFIVKSVTANGTAIVPDADGAYKYVVDADVTFAAEFDRDPDAPLAYCIPTIKYTSTHRRVSDFTVADDAGSSVTVQGVTPVSGGSVYVDRTSTALSTAAGSTITFTIGTGSGEWMHSYLYVDFGRDGDFDVDDTLTTPNGDLVGFDRYSAGGSYYYDSKGSRYSDGHTYLSKHPTFSFTLPASLAPGSYRARYKLDWDNVDPCGSSTMGSNAGAMVDFTIVVESQYLENERTVTVLADNADLGTVAIVSPATEGNTVTTNQKNVAVKATPAEGASFIDWTDSEGNTLAAEPDYVYAGEADATLTARFGYEVSYTASKFGALEVTAGDRSVASGDVLAPGTEITLKASPDAGCRLVAITVNGLAVADGATVQVNSALNIVAEFSDATGTFHIVTSGNGTVSAATEFDDITDTLTGTPYADGTPLRMGTSLYILITPDDEYLINNASVSGTLDGNLTYPDEDYFFECVTDSRARWCYAEASDADMTVSVEFIHESLAIGAIDADAADGPVEYFNLQGIRVDADNLVPGIYIRRQGDNAVKVHIR